MKKNNWLISALLLVSVAGVLGLTTPNYAGCEDFYPDEFLDLGLLCQHPTLPVISPRLNTHPPVLLSIKVFHFQKVNLLTPFMRC
jgi:hypothetical protein